MAVSEIFKCNKCGGEIEPESDGICKCTCCGLVFTDKQKKIESRLLHTLGDMGYSQTALARRNLWRAMHKKNIIPKECCDYAEGLLKYEGENFYARFAVAVNDVDQRSELPSILLNADNEASKTYADDVLDFMIPSLTKNTMAVVSTFIDKAFSNATERYKRFSVYESKAEEIDEGVFNSNCSRKVFISFSIKDSVKAVELCEYLEEKQGFSCFISTRNLRHGPAIVHNFANALYDAMNSCNVVVFISSKNSRTLKCKAYSKELVYLKNKDIKDIKLTHPEYSNSDYNKIPQEYLKHRVEYLIDLYSDEKSAVEIEISEIIFHDLDNVSEKSEVARAVLQCINETNERDYTENIHALETNYLRHIRSLIQIEDFEGAEKKLTELENEEIRCCGGGSSALYFYKILAKNQVPSVGDLFSKLEDEHSDLSRDKNFRLLVDTNDESPEKAKIIKLESEVEAYNAECEQKLKADIERARLAGDGLIFEKRDDCCFLTGVKTLISPNVYVPSEYDGCSVIGINSRSFSGQTSIEKVTISKPIKRIGDRVFSGCSSLSDVALPENLTSIEKYAFYECSALRDIKLPGSLTYLGEGTFKKCSSLTDIVLPDGIIELLDNLFYECSSLTNIILPNNLSKFHDNVFYGCTSLTNLVLPKNMTDIGESAFSSCTGLKKILLPEKIESIGQCTFYCCRSLENLVIPHGVKRIGESAFFECESLTEILIPRSLMTIDNSAFMYCAHLTRIYYEGNDEEWNNISINPGNSSISKATRYYFSADEPLNDGTYWHYDESGIPIPW